MRKEQKNIQKCITQTIDELDFAANWDRALIKIHTDIKWLNTFAVINEVAAFKILKRLPKQHLKIRDNVLNKNLARIVKSHQFSQRNLIGPILKDFKTVYAKYFFDGDLKQAIHKLEHHDEKPSKNNNNLISCLLSASMTLILMDLFLVYIVEKLDE